MNRTRTFGGRLAWTGCSYMICLCTLGCPRETLGFKHRTLGYTVVVR
jgi:hypothetical protein